MPKPANRYIVSLAVREVVLADDADEAVDKFLADYPDADASSIDVEHDGPNIDDEDE